MDPKKRIILAVGKEEFEEDFIRKVAPHVGCITPKNHVLKAFGTPQIVKILHAWGVKNVGVDEKLKDIPEEMGRTAEEYASLDVSFFTVLADAGIAGMRAAVERKGNAKVFAVTVLTSFREEVEIPEVYNRNSLAAEVIKFARDAAFAGADGIIAPPHTARLLRQCKEIQHLLIVCSAIRSDWAKHISDDDSQNQPVTPYEAMSAGVNFLMTGRPITNFPRTRFKTMLEAITDITEEIKSGLAARGGKNNFVSIWDTGDL